MHHRHHYQHHPQLFDGYMLLQYYLQYQYPEGYHPTPHMQPYHPRHHHPANSHQQNIFFHLSYTSLQTPTPDLLEPKNIDGDRRG